MTMEGPIYQPPMPYRPIPVYGRRVESLTSQDESVLLTKNRAEISALTKHFNLISQMGSLRPFREYQVGQFGHIGSFGTSQVLHGINKFSDKSITPYAEKGHSHATIESERHPINSNKVFPLPGFSKEQTSVSINSNPERTVTHPVDSMTVPVVVPCANPYSPQYGFGRKVFPCPQCRYTTDRRNNLKRHMLTMHQTCSKTLECCGIIFATKASLREHAMIFHYHGYTCFYCGRRFCRKALLKRHLSVHNGQKDYVCPVCDYATSHKSNLERHRKVHCRPEDHKHDGVPCEHGHRHFHPWKSTETTDLEQAPTRQSSEESDDEDEEINVDSD